MGRWGGSFGMGCRVLRPRGRCSLVGEGEGEGGVGRWLGGEIEIGGGGMRGMWWWGGSLMYWRVFWEIILDCWAIERRGLEGQGDRDDKRH